MISHRKAQALQDLAEPTPNLELCSQTMKLATDPRKLLQKKKFQESMLGFSEEAATRALARVIANRVLEKVNLEHLPTILQSNTEGMRNSNRSLYNETEIARKGNTMINMDLA